MCGLLGLTGGVAALLAWRADGRAAVGSPLFGTAVICGVIAGFCVSLLVTRPWEFTVRKVWLTSVAFTLVCVTGMTVCWAAILRDGGGNLAAGRTMRDEGDVQQYLEGAIPQGRSPVMIRTGLYVESLEFTSASNVAVTGYVWQRYPEGFPKDVTKGVVFPEADNAYLRYRDIAYDKTAADGTRTIGWYFTTTFRQRFDYHTYPFDRQNVWLRMWQPDFDKDAVLVPDLSSYPPWTDKRILGVDGQIVTGQWRPMYSVYSYARYSYPTSYGLKAYDRPVSYPDLYFNMVFERNFTGVVIGDLVPAGLIALVVFASLFVTSRDQKFQLYGSTTFAVMAFLVTMLLVVVVDHNQLRAISADGSVMYWEYVYFGLYLLLVLATANGVLIALDRPGAVLTRTGCLPAKALYWPLLAVVMLTGTVAVFFGVGW